MKQQLAERQAHLDNRATDAGQASNGAGLTLTPDALQDVGNNTPEAAIQTLLWAAARKNGGRLAELFDGDSLLSAAFVKLRQANPNMSVSEAESVAKDFVDKLKQHLTTGGFTNRDLNSIVSWRLDEVVEGKNVVPGTTLVRVTQMLRDGTTESDKLKLRQSGDQWFVTPSEESMAMSFTPFPEGSNNPVPPDANRLSPDSAPPK
ncbi:MAG TPA: hypothetical protein VFR76_10235 [Verrucomicrobiae bacterium]|nr:hypothetical protein [Verrucomicrobiae bacterium]